MTLRLCIFGCGNKDDSIQPTFKDFDVHFDIHFADFPFLLAIIIQFGKSCYKC